MNTENALPLIRAKLRILPGQVDPIGSVLRSETLASLRALDSTYADWMVSVTYETERKAVPKRNAPRR